MSRLEAEALFPFTQAMRRKIHQNPELGFEEVKTSELIARTLRELGLDVQTGVAKTGVVAVLEGGYPGPVVLLRFDMDALPIREETGVEYASCVEGKMHACGHDGHVAVGLTTAKILAAHQKELHGSVKFVFQPAEEGMGGAERMIAEGVLTNPKPDWAFGMHLWNECPVNTFAVVDGALMSGADIFSVVIRGKGGHAAIPDGTQDPIVAAANIITALQSIVARNVSPLQSAVVSVTRIQSGQAFNIIPEMAELGGTIRSFDPNIRKEVMRRFESIIYGVAEALGCSARVEYHEITPPVVNAALPTEWVRTSIKELYPDAVIFDRLQTMASEDMSYFLKEIPGCFFFVGSADKEKQLNYAHHHPRFDFDESALSMGAAVISQTVRQLLQGV